MKWLFIAALMEAGSGEHKIEYFYYEDFEKCTEQMVQMKLISLNTQLPIAVIPCHEPENYIKE